MSVGDRDTALDNEIVRVEVGSGVHGMAIAGTDDLDLMGVYVETKDQLLGLTESSEHYVSRTVPEGERSGPGDVDLTIYSLRKYMRLAIAGNPTVLTLLYAPESSIHTMTSLGDRLRGIRHLIVSQRAGRRFLGYLDGQRNRMLGIGPRQNRVPKRPELVERYGYDVKYASHALRLGLQGNQLLRDGSLSLPMRPGDLDIAMRVKRGEVSQEDALALIDHVRDRLARRVEDGITDLPPEPDMDFINGFLVDAHETHWRGQ